MLALYTRFRIILFITLFSAAYLLISSSFKPIEDKMTARTAITKMIASTNALSTLTFNLRIQERCDGKLRGSTSSIKIQRNPRKVYMKLAGPELLFVSGWNDNKVLVNPGGFPYVNLNLDAASSTLHKDQHHTLNEVGFDYMSDIIADAVKRSGDKFDDYFKLKGEEDWNGQSCYKVIVSDQDYKFGAYVVKKGETLMSIARKLKIGEFKVAELNKLSDFGSVKAGKVLVIPTSYAKTTEILIDKKTFLPMSIKVYDDIGLFEFYEYLNLKINPAFADNEFSKDFKGYGF